jgi:hypothetical protein
LMSLQSPTGCHSAAALTVETDGSEWAGLASVTTGIEA